MNGYFAMTEKEKMLGGMIYDANNDQQLIRERLECKELCRDYNELRPKAIRVKLLNQFNCIIYEL